VTIARPLIRACRLVLIAALLGACVTNPATGRREVILMSTEQEVRAGAQAAEQVAEEIGLVRNAELERYIEQLGARVAAYSPRKDVTYKFAIADMPETNAFALPGGWIYVSRGLLTLANSEAELANVLAHEVAHVAAMHHARSQTRSTGVGILSALGTIAAAVLGGSEAAQAASAIGQVAGAGVIASYSRDQEREADEIGQQMAARAGWDPIEMANFLQTLDREDRLRNEGPRQGSFLDSHPLTPERIVAAKTRARALRVSAGASIAPTRLAYLSRVRGLMIGKDPSQGMFDDGDFLHADMDLHLRFPSEWARQNTPTAVAAASPKRDAILVLELDSQGSDPRAAAQRFSAAQKLEVSQEGPRRVGALRAHNVVARVSDGSVANITWIAYKDQIFRITGLASASRAEAYQPLFERTVNSFRALTAAERAKFKRRVLDLATPRSRETLESLSRRTGNVWTPAETAVVNAIQALDPLPAGLIVKIAVEQPYP
jgi:predicted Zn-dependent protease